MIPVHLYCDQHLLGEHGEYHKHRHEFVKQHSVSGRIEPIVQIIPTKMKERHDEIAVEMTRRGMKHKSPFEQPDISYLPKHEQNPKVDLDYNYKDLIDRCPECRARIIESWR